MSILDPSTPASTSAPAAPSAAGEEGAGPSSRPAPSARMAPSGLPYGQPFNLPMASLEGKPNVAGRLWASFLPLDAPGPEGGVPRGVSSGCRFAHVPC